jgi:hypothetical protein
MGAGPVPPQIGEPLPWQHVGVIAAPTVHDVPRSRHIGGAQPKSGFAVPDGHSLQKPPRHSSLPLQGRNLQVFGSQVHAPLARLGLPGEVHVGCLVQVPLMQVSPPSHGFAHAWGLLSHWPALQTSPALQPTLQILPPTHALASQAEPLSQPFSGLPSQSSFVPVQVAIRQDPCTQRCVSTPTPVRSAHLLHMSLSQP